MELKTLLNNLAINLSDEEIARLEPNVKVKAKLQKANAKFEATGKDFEAKTPLQMKQCVQALGEQKMSLAEWADALGTVEGFRTQQTPAKIIAFYRKRLLDGGYIKLAA